MPPVHNFNFKWQFNPSNLFKAQSLICQEKIPVVIGNRHLKEILVRILKQLDYSLFISVLELSADSWPMEISCS